jgi:two-component system response regulator YesN
MNVKARDYISPFYKKALEIAKTYKQATGVDCFVINNKGYRLNEDGAQDGVCPFCTQLNQLCDNKADCRQAHLYGGYQAERFGGSYIYFCPINMLHWASPLMEEGLMTGALIAGPSLIIETDELIEELKSKFGEDSVEQAGLRENLEKIPLVTTEKAKALSELLLITASHLIEGDHSELTSKKDSMDQQSQISEYIQYIKQMEYKYTEFSKYPIEK